MNKEQVSGKVDELKGKVKEKVGEALHKPATEANGGQLKKGKFTYAKD